jgi:hypothetical protein
MERVVFIHRLQATWQRLLEQQIRDFGYDLMRRVSQVMLERLQATRRKLVEFYGVIE